MTRPGRVRTAVLGIDAGSSGTRWLLRTSARGEGDGGRRPAGETTLARGSAGPVSGVSYLASESGRGEAEARLQAIATAVRERLENEDVRLDFVFAGITGLTGGDRAAGDLQTLLSEHLDLPPSRIRVESDLELVYRSAFAPGAGIVVYAGTGSVALHLSADGVLHRAGGHGYLIDDAGGGFWIGRQALRAVLREADRRGAPAEGALADAVYDHVGSRAWPAIRAHVYGSGREEVAALAPAVGRAVAVGDPAAEGIVVRAGRELAHLAKGLAARLALDVPVALTGGVAHLGPTLRRAMTEGLPAGSEVRSAIRSSVETAAVLADEALD